ncbi:MAG TPA: permease, partial [Proteiniclasticum sp.]|nr:permease [Proteiniclasticum sp.]
KMIKKFKAPILVLFVFIGLAIWAPDTAGRSTTVLWDYFKEMALIIPPVFILLGLMEVWIPKNKIQKWLGSGSGIKGAGIAFALGTLPTGPLYVAFPMTATLIRKGASYANMVIFLGSWAALKIPQLMVEIKFLGISFTLIRFGLTLLALVLIGSLMEFILRRSPDKDWIDKAEKEIEQKAPGK